MTSLLIAMGLAIVWMFLCGLVSELAEKKGHSAALWYLFSLFFTPLLGFFVVGMLPSASELIPAGQRRCSACSGLVNTETTLCPYCHSDLSGRAQKEKLAA